MSIHTILEELYVEDKKERESAKTDGAMLQVNTDIRLKKVKKLMSQIDTQEIWNCHYLAYLLHHSQEKKDYKLAYKYAKKAVILGSSVTKWLYAATLDRYLISQGKKQQFGTQFIKKNGKWEILPCDDTVSDAKRKEYGVPPLSTALEKFLAKNTL